MKHRSSTESGEASVVLLFMLCWLWVYIFYAGFWGTGSGRDVGISALITLGLLLVGVPGAFICLVNKDRLSPFMVVGIVFAGIITYTAYQTYTDHHEQGLAKSLIAAARQGDTAGVAKLLKQGADVNCLFEGSTPIMVAVMEGKNETAILLAEQGARLDGVVSLAIEYKNLDMIGTLVLDRNNEQARVQQVNDALSVAAATGKWDAVQQLLDRGGNVNARDSENATLLMTAVSQDREAAVQNLLRRGADVLLRDNHSKSALMYAAEQSKQSSIFRALLRHGAYALGKDEKGLTARELFTTAMLLGHWRSVRGKEELKECDEILRILEQAEEEQKE